jgi:hypothetical protein
LKENLDKSIENQTAVEVIEGDIEEVESSVKNDNSSVIDSGRGKNGRFTAGNRFSVGRPKKEHTIVEKFRSNPKAVDLINQIIETASTLGKKNQHKDAMNCAKLVVERLVPALKSSELKIGSDDNSGFVFLPPQSEPESE